MVGMMIGKNATIIQQLVDVLASPTEAKFCDLHRFSLVKDVHGAALSALTVIFCLCFTIRAMTDSRSSKAFCWVCQSQIVMTLLATANHIFGKKYNDLMFTVWSIFISAPAKLDFYEERGGGAWYYQAILSRNVYKYSRIIVIFTMFYPLLAPLCFALFVSLPAQSKTATTTSRLSNFFLLFSLGPILYEFAKEGKCPYGFPVHAFSDASVMFTNIWSLIHLQDIDLESSSSSSRGKMMAMANGHTKDQKMMTNGKKKD